MPLDDDFIPGRYNRILAGVQGIFTPRSVCPRAGHYEDIHTHWSGATVTLKLGEVLSRPTWHLSGARRALPWDLWEHLTPFSDLDSAEVSTSPEPLPTMTLLSPVIL